MRLFSILFLFVFIASGVSGQRLVTLSSPSKNLLVTIYTEDTIRFSVLSNGKEILKPSSLALLTSQTKALGIKSHLLKSETRYVRDSIINLFPYKRRVIPNRFNELTLRFKENFSVVFRAYDDGVAYRFRLQFNYSVTIKDEIAQFHLAENASVYFPEVQKRDNADIFHTSFEENYAIKKLSNLSKSNVAFTPVLFEIISQKNICHRI
jgi:alpha-glucosidase